MKVTIVYRRSLSAMRSKQSEVEFAGTKALENGFMFIHYNQPITVMCIRIEPEEKS